MALNNAQTSETATKSPSSRARKSPASRRQVAKKRRSTARSRKASRTNGRPNASTTTKLLKQGRNALSSAYDQAWSTGKSLRRMGANASIRGSRKSFYSMIDDNPLVLGAVGLGIGMVLGAMMPSIDMRSVNTRSMGMSGRRQTKRSSDRKSRSK